MIRKNFTLLELSIVLLVIVSLASFMLSQGLPLVQQSTERSLDQKMQLLAEAIGGSPSIRDLDGSVVPNGFVNDMGAFPDPDDLSLTYSFQELLEQLTLPDYLNHNLTVEGKMFAGWNGPYLTEAGYSRLKDIIQIDLVDDDGDGNDDIRIFANGHSNLERFVYYKDHFRKRNITISGVPNTFTAKVTIDYVENGVIQSVEQDVTGSAETTVDLPTGVCAFYAELEVDYNVVNRLASPPSPDPSDGDRFLVAVTDTSTHAEWIKDQVVQWNDLTNTFDKITISNNEKLVTENNDYYVFSGTVWEETNGRTTQIIKTIKTDIILELE